MKAKLKDLTLDPKNANRHSQYGTGLLENSTRENGFGRSILISNDNVIIAGNGVAEAGASIGMENIEIIESDGNKIIAVKRTDIKSGTKEFYNMALADNIVAQKNIVMIPEVVTAIAHEFPETKFWASIVNEEPEEIILDKDKAGMVEVKFQMTGAQSAKLKQALKMAKAGVKGSSNKNAAAIVAISVHFIKSKGK